MGMTKWQIKHLQKSHNMRVLAIVQQQTTVIIGNGCRLKQCGRAAEKKEAVGKEITKLQMKVERDRKYLISLYENYVSGVLTEQEYLEMKLGYEQKIKTATVQLHQLLVQQKKLEVQMTNYIELSDWLESVNGNMTLTGSLMDRLVDRIVVYSAQEIEVYFKFKDEFGEVLENE